MRKKMQSYLVCIVLLLTIFSTLGVSFASATPGEPSNPYPANGSTAVTIFVELHWMTEGAKNDGNSSYAVYFGTENPPVLVIPNQPETTYDPGILNRNTTYFWQVILTQGDEVISGPVWSFTTAADQPPFEAVILSGPTAAGPGISLNFSAVSPDPEGDAVSYQWDWGDGTTSVWFGPYAFGQLAEAAHQWEANGTYAVKVRAKDSYNNEGAWSAPRHITIARQIEIINLKPGYVYFNFFGFDQAYGYVYSLDVLGMALIMSTGGFSVNATVSGSVRHVTFEMVNLFFKSDRWSATDDNTSDGVESYFALTPGLYKTTASAYDANGTLIDQYTRDYVLFYQVKFTVLKAILSRMVGRLKSR
jgi:hypothetical protein